jgi:hypothetical protein
MYRNPHCLSTGNRERAAEMNRNTFDVIARQADAMGANIFEIGLYKPATEDGTKEPEMLPRTWDKATLLRSVGWLKYQNSQGRNVYIRPKGEHNLSLVDDLSEAAVQRMKNEGFQPALIVETSPGNFQAWLNHGRVLPKVESTAVARSLAGRFGGDLGAADWRHFGRLSGLTNRKSKYQDSATGMYPFTESVQQARNRQLASAAGSGQHLHGASRSIDSFRGNPAYGGDGTRIDLAYAIYAIAHGCSEHEVRQAISSRDLSHKGSEKRQLEYVDRTVKKAQAVLSGQMRGR